METACPCCPERGRGAEGVFHELHVDDLSIPDFRKNAEWGSDGFPQGL